MTVSTLSVITSRLTSDARIPSWPMEIPSLTVMVPNSRATPPALRTPSLANCASLRNVMLHGVTSFHDEAMATCGFTQSSSVRPTARNIERAGAFCGPSVTSRLRGLISTGVPSALAIEATLVVSHAQNRRDGSPPCAFGFPHCPR